MPRGICNIYYKIHRIDDDILFPKNDNNFLNPLLHRLFLDHDIILFF